MIFRMVDLPAPFLPIRAILSLSFIEKVTSLNSVVPPNETDILFTLITIGNIKSAAKIKERHGIIESRIKD
ncbi:hypothetical protein GCM10022246_31330 [Pedobacter ginsengiterrae]|uniref:Uncharacterized protein n=1 Tax=Pedobacter ginsengiterrae TaxID=871696 RepID=A0ABP7Q5D6_9SPHI